MKKGFTFRSRLEIRYIPHSTEAAQCYEKYFDLLSQVDNYFELRLLTPKELQSAMYFQPKKIWEAKRKAIERRNGFMSGKTRNFSDNWYINVEEGSWWEKEIKTIGEPINVKKELAKFPRKNIAVVNISAFCNILRDLGNQKLKVLAYMLEHKDSGNCINTSWSKLEKATASCPETVRSTIGYLTDEGFLTRKGSVYRISPKVIIKGSRQKEACIWEKFCEENAERKKLPAKKRESSWYAKINEDLYLNQGVIEIVGGYVNTEDIIFYDPKGPFETVHLDTLNKILQDLGNQKINVFQYLLDCKGKKNCINLSQRKIAKAIDVSLQTVNTAITYLKKAGYLLRDDNVYRFSSVLLIRGVNREEGE